MIFLITVASAMIFHHFTLILLNIFWVSGLLRVEPFARHCKSVCVRHGLVSSSLCDMGFRKDEFKSGFVSIIGNPNVGKSTLCNAVLGQKLCAVNRKPQTTRHKIQGIITTDDYQIILSDTPGNKFTYIIDAISYHL